MPRGMMRDWAGLPSDILNNISDCLTFSVDHTRFRSVCTSWQASTPGKPQLPLILLPKDFESRTFSLFSLTDNRIHDFPLPRNTLGKRICGSSHGWLVLVCEERRSVMLCDPLTQACIQLPPITSGWRVPMIGPDGRNCEPISVDLRRPCRLFKATLSSNPAVDPHSCTVSAIFFDDETYSTASKLAVCQLNDRSWTILEENEEEFYDAIFYNKKLYALDKYWRMFIYNATNPMSSWMCHFAEWPSRVSQGYLIKSGGELLAVMRFHPVGACVNCGVKFLVYKLDLSEMLHPVEIKMESLGDRALFVGLNHSFSLSIPSVGENTTTTAIAGCRSDCIYYTNYSVFNCNHATFECDSCEDFGLFDVKQQKLEQLRECSVKWEPEWEPSIWITPSLL